MLSLSSFTLGRNRPRGHSLFDVVVVVDVVVFVFLLFFFFPCPPVLVGLGGSWCWWCRRLVLGPKSSCRMLIEGRTCGQFILVEF